MLLPKGFSMTLSNESVRATADFIVRVGIVGIIALGSLGMTWAAIKDNHDGMVKLQADMATARVDMKAFADATKLTDATSSREILVNQRLLRETCLSLAILAHRDIGVCNVPVEGK
jgi:hypothetical protein